jgi:hypothetical protein
MSIHAMRFKSRNTRLKFQVKATGESGSTLKKPMESTPAAFLSYSNFYFDSKNAPTWLCGSARLMTVTATFCPEFISAIAASASCCSKSKE